MVRFIRAHRVPFIASLAVALALVIAGVTVAQVRAADRPWTTDRYVSYVRDAGALPADQVSDDAIAGVGQTLCGQLDAGTGAKQLADMVAAGKTLPNGTYVGLSDDSMGDAPLTLTPEVAAALITGAVHAYCPGHEKDLAGLPE